MAIPDYQTLMLPLLKLAEGGQILRFRDAVEQLASEFKLTDEERSELIPSSTSPTFDNRVGWARTYLKQAGLIQSERRGTFQITQRGRDLLAEKPARIDVALLGRYPEFRAFRTRRRDKADVTLPEHEITPIQTPQEDLVSAYQKLRRGLEQDLLEQVNAASPAFFERLVVKLLRAMGYGGSRQEAGEVVGRSGDEGIDGIINEDKLGLGVIYVQAKRWQATVGRPEIHRFAGALQGQRAAKGVFIATSSFQQGG